MSRKEIYCAILYTLGRGGVCGLPTLLAVVLWLSVSSAYAQVSKDIKDFKDFKDIKDTKDFKDIKDFKDTKNLKDTTAIVLQEVVVSGTSRSGLSPGQVIGRGVIEALPSANVADALKYMAGVQIKDYGGLGGQKTINVRSLGSQHVGVYIDGVRITNAQNGTVDLGKYSLSTLESVSLFNANKAEALMMATEYASASTVYLQTRRPEGNSMEASAAAASFGTYKGAATWTFLTPSPSGEGRGGTLSGFIDASFTSSKGDYPFEYHTEYEDTTGTRRNSDIRMLRVESCLFHKGWQWHTYYFDSERGLPGGIVRRLSDAYTDVGREWDRNFFSQLTYKKNIPLAGSGGLGVRGIVKYANDWLHYRSDYPENISVHANNQYHQQDVYGGAAVSWNPRQSSGERDADWKLSLSSDLRWSDLVCDVKNFRYVYRLDSKTSLSAFYNWQGLNLGASGLYTNVTDHTRGEAKPLSRLTWNAMAAYSFVANGHSPLRGLTLRAFYKSVFRAPTLNDLYYTLVGNRNLKPEYTKQFDVGLSYNLPPLGGSRRGALGLDLDFYYNHVEDRIVCLPLKGSYQWTMLNYGYTRCLGVNASLNANYKQHRLLFTGTFQDDRNRTDPTEDAYNDYIAYSPRWSMTAVYTFNYKGWLASLSHMFVDKRYWTAENAIEEPLGAYNCTDVKLSKEFRVSKISKVVKDSKDIKVAKDPMRLALELECQDLFDTRYEMIQRWPMPGRRYALTFKIKL